jgi:hypothetical protein
MRPLIIFIIPGTDCPDTLDIVTHPTRRLS